MRHIEQTLGAGLVALALFSCAESDSNSETSHADAGSKVDSARTDADGGESVGRFVGEVEDSDVRVAIVADDKRARLFFCGGEASVAEKTHWFNLSKDADELEVEEGKFALRARFDGDAVSGEYAVGDERRAFSSKRVDKATLAGLYEGTGECGRLGLIVSQSAPKAEIEAQGACVGMGHTPEQVNPILPISAEDGKIRVKAPGRDDSLLLGAAGLSPL